MQAILMHEDHSTWAQTDATFVVPMDDEQMQQLTEEDYEPRHLDKPYTGFSVGYLLNYLEENNLMDDFLKKFDDDYNRKYNDNKEDN